MAQKGGGRWDLEASARKSNNKNHTSLNNTVSVETYGDKVNDNFFISYCDPQECQFSRMFRVAGIRRVESRVIKAEKTEASKEGKAELRVIRGQVGWNTD